MASPPDTSLASSIMTDEQAKALAAGSQFGATVVTEIGNLARYAGWILGTTPADIVGLAIGTSLRAVHILIAAKLDQLVHKKLEQWGVKEPQGVSPSLGLPLLRGAYDESRPELQELWATLIAAAMDPKRAGRVRLSFIETLKQFDPLDALVLKTYTEVQGIENDPNNLYELAKRIGKSDNEVWLSVENLQRLSCIYPNNPANPDRVLISRYGRAIIRACSD